VTKPGNPDDRALDPDGTWHRSWRPVDLALVLDGTWTPPEPTVGLRQDKIGLFYPGRTHTVSSETEAGKSWFALSAAADELAAGNQVVYLDFEDDEGGITGRLLALRLNRDTIRKRFHYVRPTDPLGTGINLDDLTGITTNCAPTLVIIDGVTEAMVLHGLNPLDNKDVAVFGWILPKRLAASGPAVVCLDHVNKDRKTRGRYAIGGVHKLNGLDGAAYILENRTPFGVGLTGRSTIKIAKDRPAQLRRHALPASQGLHWFGDLVLTSHAVDFAEVEIAPPNKRDESFVPTLVMTKIAQLLTKTGKPLSGREVQKRLGGNAPTNRHALAALVAAGHITKTPHKLLHPFPPEEPEKDPRDPRDPGATNLDHGRGRGGATPRPLI
jgi:hypothetical protein